MADRIKYAVPAYGTPLLMFRIILPSVLEKSEMLCYNRILNNYVEAAGSVRIRQTVDIGAETP